MDKPTKWYLVKDIMEQSTVSNQSVNKAIRKLLINAEIEELVIPYKVERGICRDRYIRIRSKNENR